MEYVDELLRTQQTLARALTQEPDGALPQTTGLRGGRRAENQADDADAAAERAAERDTGAVKTAPALMQEEENGARELLQELVRMDAVRLRMAARRTADGAGQAAPEASERMQTAAGGVPAPEGGGMPAQYGWAAELPETEGVRMQRSMGDISRFFERDARRYGG